VITKNSLKGNANWCPKALVKDAKKEVI